MGHGRDQWGPPGGGKHRWRPEPDTGPILMGKHGDEDGDGLINRLDPDSPEYEDSGVEHNGLGGPMVARAAARPSLSGAVIQSALASIGAVGKQISGFDALAAGARAALQQSPRGLTKEGAAAFLATCAQESAYFRTTTEYGKSLRYDPFRGRTFTQITWESGYRSFGQWCKARGLVNDPEAFVKNPAALSDLQWAWVGPLQYWETHGIWRWANAGQFRSVSQAINGGNGKVGTSFTPHGWDERQAMYAAFLRAGNALLPGPAVPPTPPRPKREPEMIERPIYPSPQPVTGRIIAPTGSASATVGKAWFSASFDGGARVEAWFQKAQSGNDGPAPGAGKAIDWTLRNAERPWVEVPSGTEFIQYRVTAIEGSGALAVELAPK